MIAIHSYLLANLRQPSTDHGLIRIIAMVHPTTEDWTMAFHIDHLLVTALCGVSHRSWLSDTGERSGESEQNPKPHGGWKVDI